MKKSVKTVVMAIDEPGSICLKQAIELGFNVVLLLTRFVNSNDFIQPCVIAEINKIPVEFPSSLNDIKIIKRIGDLRPDIIISSWFHLKIPKAIIETARLAAVNFHPSLLPKYRSATPIEWAIMNGETHTGLTCHLLEEKFDTGQILWQKQIKIAANETTKELSKRIALLSRDGFKDILLRVRTNNFIGAKQLDEDASYYPKRSEKDAIIDWNNPASKIHNQIRAMNPRPIARTYVDGEPVFIYRSLQTKMKHKQIPGSVIKCFSKNELLIACGKSETLHLKEIVTSKKLYDLSSLNFN